MSRKKPNYTFFRDGEKYLFTTGESPNELENFIAIAWEGPTPDNLTETAKPVKQLQALERIEPAAVPLEWWNGFAEATGRLTKREPATQPATQPITQPATQPITAPLVAPSVILQSLDQEPLAEIVIVSLIIATGLGLLIW